MLNPHCLLCLVKAIANAILSTNFNISYNITHSNFMEAIFISQSRICSKGKVPKNWYFLGIFPKPVAPPPLSTFMNKNVTFDQKSWVFKAKNNGHQNFT